MLKFFSQPPISARPAKSQPDPTRPARVLGQPDPTRTFLSPTRPDPQKSQPAASLFETKGTFRTRWRRGEDKGERARAKLNGATRVPLFFASFRFPSIPLNSTDRKIHHRVFRSRWTGDKNADLDLVAVEHFILPRVVFSGRGDKRGLL